MSKKDLIVEKLFEREHHVFSRREGANVFVFFMCALIGLFGGVAGSLLAQGTLGTKLGLDRAEVFSPDSSPGKERNGYTIKPVLAKDFNEIEKKIYQTSSLVAESSVSIFVWKGEGTAINSYKVSDEIGQGFIFTSDGWIVSDQSVVYDSKARYAVRMDNELVLVKDVVKDSFSGAVFLRVEKNNLPVAALVSEDAVRPGQMVMVLSGNDTPVIAHLSSMKTYLPEQAASSSEKLDLWYSLDRDLPDSFEGGAVFDLDGKVVGIVHAGGDSDDAKTLLVPSRYIRRVMQSVFKEKKSPIAYLGVRSTELSQVIADEGFWKEFQKKHGMDSDDFSGAWLKSFDLLASVVAASPAQKAGLREDDIILKVNDDLVDGVHTLAVLVSEYSPGDTVKFTVLRMGKHELVPVELGKIPE